MTLSLVSPDLPARFYASLARRQRGDVLVLGAGEGRVACGLEGVEVFALEGSALLRPAVLPPNVEWQVGDARALRLGRVFPLVLAPQSALLTCREMPALEAVLETVRLHLAPKGLFAFDVQLPPEGVWADAHLRSRAGAVHPWRHAQWDFEDLEAALESASLSPHERYRDFEGTPWEETDTTQICVAVGNSQRELDRKRRRRSEV